ncbi:SDR family oxidoreductase [Rhizobium sp. XQZ8]|uniref:SDR family oxidoreductase n=1 Tax=Rhizobium populisoli TaxID=2859785 RepID=UPI001C685FE5|nr:SDR family oxidoreductase [Rhizobium populisoli]MBW6419976.1 SDR family oxidoreductase [Rhizobium populisoli]
MRVFVTGATGFVGSAVVKELLEAGHSVLGLARSDEGAAALAATGANVHRGSIYDIPSLQAGAEQADGVIHTAFNHDFSKFKENCETDRRVIEGFGDVLAGSDKPLLITSGTGLLTPGKLATEEDEYTSSSEHIPRVASEEAAAAVKARGVNVSVIRLPPSVHGDGDHGFVPLLIGVAREKGMAAYIGEGQNRWAAVHRSDAAKVYRLALERGVAARYHAVGESGVPFRQIAEVIGSRLGVPVVSKTPEEAAAHFGWFAHFAQLDNHASSALTQGWLGWNPTGPRLIEDLDRPAYFGN